MATKYGSRKKHNAGTIRSSTNNKGGSRTRKTTTVKSGGSTRSRSVNRNGTVKLTTTRKTAAGYVRTSKTVGSAPKPPKAPKFVKAKSYKAPKMPKIKVPKFKASSSSSSGGWSLFDGGSKKSKAREVEYIDDYDDEEYRPLSFGKWLLLIILAPFIWVLGLVWPLIAFALYWLTMFVLGVIALMIFLWAIG